MGNAEKKRQKKLAKKRKKREMQKKNSGGEKPSIIKEVNALPFDQCFVDSSDNLLYSIIITKTPVLGETIIAGFIVDTTCLGVKSSFLRKVPTEQFAETPVQGVQWALEDVKKLIIGAVEYANSLTFRPDKDFKKVFRIFDDVDETLSTKEFTYGKDGKPFFVSGPNESPARCMQIKETLDRVCGEGNYGFMIGFGGSDMFNEEW